MIKMINGIEVPATVYNRYITDTVGKVFKLLPIYEECLNINNFTNYESYLEKLIIMFMGSNILFDKRDFLSLISILEGMKVKEDLTHSIVKSLVFHCIEMLDKLRI